MKHHTQYDNQEQLTEELRVNVAQETAKQLMEGIEELARSAAWNQANTLAFMGYIGKDRTKESAEEDTFIFTQALRKGFAKIYQNHTGEYSLEYFTDFLMNLIIQEPEIEYMLNELPEAPTVDDEAATIAEKQWEEDTGR